MPLEARIVLDQRERPRASAADELQVLGQARELQVGHPRLLRVEQRALAAEPQVLVGELEPVGGADHRVDAGARASTFVARSDSSNRTQNDAVRAAADPAAQLVQLREAEALGVLDRASRSRSGRRRPTSITVVEISRSVSPAPERAP